MCLQKLRRIKSVHPTHQAHHLFQLLHPGSCYKSLPTKTNTNSKTDFHALQWGPWTVFPSMALWANCSSSNWCLVISCYNGIQGCLILQAGNNAVFSGQCLVSSELRRPLCIHSSSHEEHGKVGHRLFQGQGKKKKEAKFQSKKVTVLMFLRRVRRRSWMIRSIWAISSLMIKASPILCSLPVSLHQHLFVPFPTWQQLKPHSVHAPISVWLILLHCIEVISADLFFHVPVCLFPHSSWPWARLWPPWVLMAALDKNWHHNLLGETAI